MISPKKALALALVLPIPLILANQALFHGMMVIAQLQKETLIFIYGGFFTWGLLSLVRRSEG